MPEQDYVWLPREDILHFEEIERLVDAFTDLGVDSAKLAAALKGVVAQRLIRRLCDECRIVANDGIPAQLRASVADRLRISNPKALDDQ